MIAIENARLFNETQGGAGAADCHGRYPEGDRQFAVGRAAGIRRHRRERQALAGKSYGGGHARHRRLCPFGGQHGRNRGARACCCRASCPIRFPPTGRSRQSGADRASLASSTLTPPIPISRGRSRNSRGRVGWRSMLVVPMLRNGIAIGTIGITRREAGSFDDKTIDLAEDFCGSGRDRDRERPAVQRDAGGAGTADRHRRHPEGDRFVRPPTCSRCSRQSSRAPSGCSVAFRAAVFRFIDGIAHLQAITPTNPAADAVMQNSFPRPIADVFSRLRSAHAGRLCRSPIPKPLSDDIRDYRASARLSQHA